jgi:hypothetical protein
MFDDILCKMVHTCCIQDAISATKMVWPVSIIEALY